MFPDDFHVVTLIAEIFFFRVHMCFPLFAEIVRVHFTLRTSMVIATIEFIYGLSVGIIPIHQVRSDADFTDMVAPMQNMDFFRFHKVIQPMKHVFMGKTGVWFKVRSSSTHIPTTRHGFISAVEVQSISIKTDDVGTRSCGVILDECPSHFSIPGENDTGSSHNVLLDNVV